MWRCGAWFGLAVLVAACGTVPYTNRSQLVLISAREEAALGAQAFKEVVTEEPVLRAGGVVTPVVEVGQRLAAVAQRPDFDWRFVVIDKPDEVNAFCLPGGKVAVYTGILPVARDTAGLAVVMGHEIAHALARHGAERMSQGMVAQLGGALLGAGLGDSQSGQMILAAYGLGAQYGVLLPYSRTQESEADQIGLMLMARAGYDPREAVAFWQRMDATTSASGAPPEFLSTHPGHSTRVRQLSGWMPEATRVYEQSTRARVVPLVASAS
ncbi:MAG: M48 family metallopeptidase [bacterium]|nr:M48 family metallopeptidase [bacterium]